MEYKVGDKVVVQYCKFSDEPHDCALDKNKRDFSEYETVIVGSDFKTDNCYYILFENGWNVSESSELNKKNVDSKYHNEFIWSIHPSNIIRKIEDNVSKKVEGCNCLNCNNYSSMSENNYKQGDKEVFLCFECRAGYMWKYTSLVKIG